MSKYKPKEGPVVPVIDGNAADAGRDREEEMRKWEEAAQARRAAENNAAVAAAVPAPSPEPVSAAAPPAGATFQQATPSTAVAKDGPPGASGFLAAPAFKEPESADPATRLAVYSRGIEAVEYAARANHERAEQQRLIGLGLRLRAIKQEDLHLVAGFDTFGDLTDARFNIKKHQANNILRVLGVAQALEDVTTQELKERPLRILVPVLDTHGAEAVRETWQEASRHGNVTDTTLEKAANFLGYAPPKDISGPETKKTAPALPGGMLKESTRAVDRLRLLAKKDRETARRQAVELKSAVEELVAELSVEA